MLGAPTQHKDDHKTAQTLGQAVKHLPDGLQKAFKCYHSVPNTFESTLLIRPCSLGTTERRSFVDVQKGLERYTRRFCPGAHTPLAVNLWRKKFTCEGIALLYQSYIELKYCTHSFWIKLLYHTRIFIVSFVVRLFSLLMFGITYRFPQLQLLPNMQLHMMIFVCGLLFLYCCFGFDLPSYVFVLLFCVVVC